MGRGGEGEGGVQPFAALCADCVLNLTAMRLLLLLLLPACCLPACCLPAAAAAAAVDCAGPTVVLAMGEKDNIIRIISYSLLTAAAAAAVEPCRPHHSSGHG
jgi:hypothetical protein